MGRDWNSVRRDEFQSKLNKRRNKTYFKICERCKCAFEVNGLQLQKKFCTRCTKTKTPAYKARKVSRPPTNIIMENCFYCGVKLDHKTTHFDHIIPLSRGGEDSSNNKMEICARCNLQKNNQAPWEYIEWLKQRTRQESLDAIIEALFSITGKRFTVCDLLEYQQ